MQKKRRGAPRKAVKASKLINMRVTEQQHARWNAAALAAGKSLSAWLKELADRQAGQLPDARPAGQAPGQAPRRAPARKTAGAADLPFVSWEAVEVRGSLDWMPVVIDGGKRAWVLSRAGETLAWERAEEADVHARAKVMTTGNFFVYFRDLLYEAGIHPSQLGPG